MKKEKSFYDIFEQVYTEDLEADNNLSETQKASIRDNAKFLNKIDDEYYYRVVALDIIRVIKEYNLKTNLKHGLLKRSHYQREKDIKSIEKFLSIFGRIKATHALDANEKWVKDVKKLFKLTNNFLEMIKDEDKIRYIVNDFPSKTKLKNLISMIIKEYDINVTTRDVKKFIDNLDTPPIMTN